MSLSGIYLILLLTELSCIAYHLFMYKFPNGQRRTADFYCPRQTLGGGRCKTILGATAELSVSVISVLRVHYITKIHDVKKKRPTQIGTLFDYRFL
jgi:hypothetical protein